VLSPAAKEETRVSMPRARLGTKTRRRKRKCVVFPRAPGRQPGSGRERELVSPNRRSGDMEPIQKVENPSPNAPQCRFRHRRNVADPTGRLRVSAATRRARNRFERGLVQMLVLNVR
jgi:hypothetical protein